MTDAIESSVDRAIARLDERPDWSLTCWSCGHTYTVPCDPLKDVFRCDECGASTAYGEPMPKITITPHVDRRFLVTKFESGKGEDGVSVDVVMARAYAAEFAMEILSVTEPVAYRAFSSILDKIRGRNGGGDPTADQVAVELDAVRT